MYANPLLALIEAAPWVMAAILFGAFLLFAIAMQPRYQPDDKEKTAVIIDDDAAIRRGLRGLIESRTPFKVVGEAHRGDEGLQVVDAVRPDLVVIDVKLAGIDGIEAARRIRSMDPRLPIVAFSSPDDDATGTIMRRAGASAHLVKGDDPDTIIETIMDFA